MKERGKLVNNTVVATVMSNFGLFKAFDEIGIDYAKTAVGDKYVYEYMKEHGCCLGGEQSGHIIFSKYASTGDGILTSLKIMQVIMSREKKLSELAAPFVVYPQVLENVRVKDKKAAQSDPDVQAAVAKVTEALGTTGRILVRESGTEPLVRVMVEAEDEAACRKYVSEVVDVIKANGHAV
jgi:phosphoglucosamine mutase